MSLPIIHPLHEGDPLPRAADGSCMCNWCRHWSPLIKHVRAQLDDSGKALLNEYVNHVMAESEDAESDQARLNGDWPDWECLKGFHPSTHRVVEMTEDEKAQWQLDHP